MATFGLTVKSRQVFGKRLAKSRRQGLTPANIVTKGQDSLAIEVDQRVLAKALDQVGYTQPVELTIDQDKKVTALVDSVQFDAVSQALLHVVFVAVKAGEQVTAQVPLELTGDSPGVQAGLMLLQSAYTLEIEAEALNLPESIKIDVSSLVDDGQVLRVDSLQLPAGVSPVTDPETVLVRLEMSRSQISAEQQDETTETSEETAEGGEESTTEEEA